MSVLQREWETYQRELPGLLEQEGKYVLIHQDEVLGVFNSREKAIDVGRDRLGFVPFMVKQIQADEKPVYLRFPPATAENGKDHPATVGGRRRRGGPGRR